MQSQPGDGTTFTIYLPASEETGPRLKTQETINTIKGSQKVLIMDDDEMVKSVTQSILSFLGFEVICDREVPAVAVSSCGVKAKPYGCSFLAVLTPQLLTAEPKGGNDEQKIRDAID